jgi:hypothetical protein
MERAMDPIVLHEYSSEQRFVLYEASAFTALCGDAVVFRAMGGLIAGPSIDLIFFGLVYSLALISAPQTKRVGYDRDGFIRF